MRSNIPPHTLRPLLQQAAAALRATGLHAAVRLTASVPGLPCGAVRHAARLHWPLDAEAPHLQVCLGCSSGAGWVLRSTTHDLLQPDPTASAGHGVCVEEAGGEATGKVSVQQPWAAHSPPVAGWCHPVDQADQADQTGQAVPAYLHQVLERAATRLRAEGLPRLVRFAWWADGKDTAFFARLVWHTGLAEAAPRVAVFDGRSGDLVCMSHPGRPFMLDPARVLLDMPADALDRAEWVRQRRAGAVRF